MILLLVMWLLSGIYETLGVAYQRSKKEVKKNIVKTLVWSVALYRAEMQALKKSEIKRVNALKIWL